MIPPPLAQRFYEYDREKVALGYDNRPILSRPWQMFFGIAADSITNMIMAPMQEAILLNGTITRPWQRWFIKAGELQSIAEPPIKTNPLLEGDYVSEPWGQWFVEMASA